MKRLYTVVRANGARSVAVFAKSFEDAQSMYSDAIGVCVAQERSCPECRELFYAGENYCPEHGHKLVVVR